jgi:hypothetical protein
MTTKSLPPTVLLCISLSALIGGCRLPDDALVQTLSRRIPSVALLIHLLNDGLTPPEQKKITIAWAGDTVMGSSYGLPANEGRDTFRGVSQHLAEPDLMMVNLEGTFSVGGVSKCAGSLPGSNCIAFQAPPAFAAPIADAGIDLVNFANNHSYDFGATGYESTVGALRAHGIKYTGAPGQITKLRVDGVRLAVMGFAPDEGTASILDIPGAQALVRKAARDAEIVVVLMHAGAEGTGAHHTPEGVEIAFGQNRGDTRAFTHAVIEAGADVVLGSGPHAVRGIERYKGRPIAYSLGNFVGHGAFNTSGSLALSGILTLTLDDEGCVTSGRWVSVRLVEPGVPVLDPSHASAQLAASLSGEDFEHTYPMDDRGRLSTPACDN